MIEGIYAGLRAVVIVRKILYPLRSKNKRTRMSFVSFVPQFPHSKVIGDGEDANRTWIGGSTGDTSRDEKSGYKVDIPL